MRVTSTVKLDMSRIRELSEAAVYALEQTGEAIHNDVEQSQVMPLDTGNLQNESTFVDTSMSERGAVTIVSSTPYARRLYYHPEYHFQKTHNPNAQGKWYKDYLPGGKKSNFAREKFKEIYRRIKRKGDT